MADTSAQDKNLPASQRKLDKARAEGQVARSRDLGHFAAIASGRTRFNPGEIAAPQWVIALIAYALMLGGHSHIIGVSPFPTFRPASDEITQDLSLSKIKFEHTG